MFGSYVIAKPTCQPASFAHLPGPHDRTDAHPVKRVVAQFSLHNTEMTRFVNCYLTDIALTALRGPEVACPIPIVTSSAGRATRMSHGRARATSAVCRCAPVPVPACACLCLPVPACACLCLAASPIYDLHVPSFPSSRVLGLSHPISTIQWIVKASYPKFEYPAPALQKPFGRRRTPC